MQSKQLKKVVIELLKKSNKAQLKKSELLDNLARDVVEELIEQEMIIEKEKFPTRCPKPTCDNDVKCINKNGTLLIRDIENPNHSFEKDINDHLLIKLKLEKLFPLLLKDLFPNSEVKQINREKEFSILSMNSKELDIRAVCSLSHRVKEKDLYKIISKFNISRHPLILCLPSTKKNVTTLDELMLHMPLGNLVYPLYIEDLKREVVKEQVASWIKRINSIEEKKSDVLEDIPSDRADLLASVDLNPTYFLSLLTKIRNLKASGRGETFKGRETWEVFQDIVALTFRSVYSSDIRFGGRRWKNEPDNLFIVNREKEGNIAGIVDTKFSEKADLGAEKTEKHLGYIEDVANHPLTPKKIAIIYPCIRPKSEKNIEKLFDRLYPQLQNKQYMIVFHLNAIELILNIYIGTVLKGKVNLSKRDLNFLLDNIFDEEWLKDKGFEINRGLYRIDFKTLKEVINPLLDDPSAIQKMYEEILPD